VSAVAVTTPGEEGADRTLALLTPEPETTSARAPGAVLMSLGTIGSGVLAYAFNAIAARALGPDAYGPIAVLWAAMFLVAIVLFRPVEQTLSRAVAERTAAGEDVRPVLRSVAMLAVGVLVAALVPAALAWNAITDRLFDGQSLLTAMLLVGVAGYGASYFVRGVIGGRRWYAGFGVLLLADGLVRVVLVLPLFVWASTSLAGAALAAAAIAGAIAPLLTPGREAVTRRQGTPGRPFHLRAAAGFASATAVVAAGDQILLSGGPVLVMLHGGHGASKAAGLVFAATMLVRAPAYLFQGVAAALLPNLTTMLVNDDEHGFRRAVLHTVGIIGAFSVVTTLGAFVLGPLVMGILYGDGFDAARVDLALLAAGAGGYMVAQTLSQATLARALAVATAAVWAGSAVLFVGLELALSGSPLHRVAIAFCVAALANAAAFWLLSARRRA